MGRGKYGKRITEEAVLQGKSLLFSHVHNRYPVFLFRRKVIFPPLDFQFLFLTQALHGQRLIPFRTKPRGNRCQAVRPSPPPESVCFHSPNESPVSALTLAPSVPWESTSTSACSTASVSLQDRSKCFHWLAIQIHCNNSNYRYLLA